MGKIKYDEVRIFAAFPAGVRKAGEELSFYIDQFKKILNPRTGGYKGLGGFKAIGSYFRNTDGTGKHFGRSQPSSQLSWLL
jgi:regulator of sigma E protease